MKRLTALPLLLALLLLALACTREVERVVVVTPTELPATATARPPATPTLAPTPETGAYALECVVVNTKLEDPLPANVYALRASGGTFVPPTEVAGVRVEITGEAGEAVRSGDQSTSGDYYGNLIVTIDEERTYTGSQHTYRIAGSISYRVADVGTAAPPAAYKITVSGGGFGTAPRTCRK